MNQQHRRPLRRIVAVGLGVLGSTGCRGSSLWTVAAPVNEITESALNSPTAAQQALLGAEVSFTGALSNGNSLIAGVILPTELLSDEYTVCYIACGGVSTDARVTSAEEPHGSDEGLYDHALSALLLARSSLLVTVPYLAANEIAPNQSLTGQALALTGYAELLMAEYYCAGVPLTQAVSGGGLAFGHPLTTDSLLGVAEQHFRQALKASYPSVGDSAVFYLASVGLGRTLVDRGRFDTAAAVVENVPLGFVYNLYGQASLSSQLGETLYWNQVQYFTDRGWYGPIIANDEGGTGNNFVSSDDPRLFLTSVGITGDGQYQDRFYPGTHFPDTLIWWPVKFGSSPAAFTALPLATGIEAQLIAAEDSFWHGSLANVYPYLDTLRQKASQTYINAAGPVPILSGDTITCTGHGDTLCIKTLFRERAFWLYGLGSRLGDMRREERQYGLADAQVFPHGPYLRDSTDSAYLATSYGFTLSAPWKNYGTDVSLSLPTAASGQTTINPNVTPGCLAGTTTQTP